MAGSAASTPNPDSYWRASPPIKYTDTVNAGWSQISNATDLLVYNGVAENRTYAHHPELYYSVKTKTVYLIHSSAPIDEDSMGQDIWITVSHDDGQSWTPPHPILPAALLSNQTNTYNFTYWCDASIWQRALQALTVVEVNGVVYTIGQTTDFYCWGDIGSGSKAAGRIARAVTSSGTEADDPCWLSMNNWTEVHLFNETVYGTEYGMKFCQDKDAINALIAEPDEVPAWGDWLYNHDLHAADGVHYMQENTHAVWIVDDSSITGGYWQRFWRDITATNNTQSVWVETTISIRGADWYPHVREEYGNKIFQTNIPDAKTKQFLGVLSGSGDRYFVSNSRNNSELIRQPLTIALSRGADLSYTNIGVLRTGADPFPAPDTRDYKNVGFSYPTAVQVGNSLIVSYSEDKQNIWVTYVDISDLP
ncbi:hypothetical protein BD289DRAFT_462467 [Coniella lustricola]|uniref:Sialidase n=1 Tax=Coniella lustricola TaxID=2025994 RepID=A0A2T3A0E3_9PEZI|nr:hypothetical protein BD289DRAFT_462467 [Coniella lustricola]